MQCLRIEFAMQRRCPLLIAVRLADGGGVGANCDRTAVYHRHFPQINRLRRLHPQQMFRQMGDVLAFQQPHFKQAVIQRGVRAEVERAAVAAAVAD